MGVEFFGLFFDLFVVGVRLLVHLLGKAIFDGGDGFVEFGRPLLVFLVQGRDEVVELSLLLLVQLLHFTS